MKSETRGLAGQRPDVTTEESKVMKFLIMEVHATEKAGNYSRSFGGKMI